MLSPHLRQALEVYTKGTKAWFIDEQESWVSATVVSSDINDSSIKIKFVNDNDPSREHVYETTPKELEKDKGASLPPLRNPPKMESVDDLTNLSYLNEPSVLHTIRTRYQQRDIYTYSGIVLIATNPFARVTLYEPEVIQQYSGRRRGELPPHLFAIAEDAYRCMIREGKNQTIIVSGESGAGKTVSAKYIMRYFATADDKEAVGKKSKKGAGAMTEVEEQILATNPIMEAFGNAKTTRNDNSSRFGKYIEIQFDKQCNIVGAKIRTYLLERSRLIFQPQTERNYHIFYQLCTGASDEERRELKLREWTEFHYMNQSGTGTIPGVDDAKEFEITKKSLEMVGISKDTQQQIFRLLAALLHLGNIEIGGRNDAMLSDNDESLQLSTSLLGINTNEFRKWIVRKQIITRSEKIMTNLSPTQAQVVRDSVAKYVYSNLFDWLVSVVNDSLACRDQPDRVKTFIGVLDIYGFEHFKKNSFEQFCINYANEKLQQQFNQHVFKLEQEEYVRENIDWKFIEFSDNQKCIEMIEAKMGILSLLDEESRLPSGSDQGFCNKLYSTFGTPAYQDYFKKPRFSNNAFTVVHYAHEVQYEADGFMDKNKDTVPDEHLTLLQNSEFEFLVEIIRSGNAASPSPTNNGAESQKKLSMAKKPTLGSMFKLSLINLMDTIGETNVHYIRCIKPNEAKTAWVFEPNMVLAQLRACGVLETIRISCAGYPSRWTFEEFADRYYALVDAKFWYPRSEQDTRKLCTAIIDTHIHDPDKYQIGSTKIFFRAGQLAYMEKLRTDRWSEVAIVLQKNARRFIERRRYLKIIEFVVRVQQVARKIVGQARLDQLRREKAATVIQKNWRCHVQRKWYQSQIALLIQLQAGTRALLARKRFCLIREHNAATQIQRIVRGWFARKRYHTQRNHIIRVQAAVRGRNARKQLKVMRAEARSVSHFKEVSYKLENKVVELTQSLAQQKEEKARLKSKAAELQAQVQSWIAKYDQLDTKAKGLEDMLGKSSPDANQWADLQSHRDDLRNEYISSMNKIKLQDKEIARLAEELAAQKQEFAKLQKASSEVVEKAKDEPNLSELKSQIAALKAQLSSTLRHPRRQQQQKTSTAARNGNRTSISPLRRGSLASERTGLVKCSEEHPGHELCLLLQDDNILEEDVLGGLVKSLACVLPDASNPPPLKELAFPAHIMGYCVFEMCRRGYVEEAESWLGAIVDGVEKHCLSFVGEEANVPCAFWLINMHELYSAIYGTEPKLEQELHQKGVSPSWPKVAKLIAAAKYELQTVQDAIYSHWLSELKKLLHRVVVPALIESQTLPGFMATNGSSSTNANGQASSTSMEDLLSILTKVHDTMQGYAMDKVIMEQVQNELLKYIGVTAFNDLLTRRNFNTWKRAMQIQYNITHLEEWCKTHGATDATIQLEHLVQASKLLQLKKATAEDINTICDICWILSPAQINKLMQSYVASEYEEPINRDALRLVSGHANEKKDGSSTVLLGSVPFDENVFEIPAPRCDQAIIDTYLPSHVELNRLRQVVDMMVAKPDAKALSIQ